MVEIYAAGFADGWFALSGHAFDGDDALGGAVAGVGVDIGGVVATGVDCADAYAKVDAVFAEEGACQHLVKLFPYVGSGWVAVELAAVDEPSLLFAAPGPDAET